MRLVFAASLSLLCACGSPSPRCNMNVPFSVDTSVSEAEASRLATALGVNTIANECDRACKYVSEEKQPPDGSTWTASAVTTCTLRMPSTNMMGMPVAGSLRCDGTGTRCAAP